MTRAWRRPGRAGRAAILAGAAALVLATGSARAESCEAAVVDLRGAFGKARFAVEIADDVAERNRGLMFRDHLPASQGMLFVYERPGQPVFWMKNTLIPLDMIFVTPEGRVSRVHENAIPGDLTGIDGGPGVLAVLEIRGGLARAIGIVPGTELRHPAFGAAAVWPCGGADSGADTGADLGENPGGQ